MKSAKTFRMKIKNGSGKEFFFSSTSYKMHTALYRAVCAWEGEGNTVKPSPSVIRIEVMRDPGRKL